MYIQEISIGINTSVDKDQLVNEFNLLMSFYRANGQTQGRIESQYITNDKIAALPFTLERNSLDKKYNNFYVNRQSDKLVELCNSALHIQTVGKSYDSYEGSCTCKNSGFYILTTNYTTIVSPLMCGTCNKSVPLYRLPAYYDQGYLPILSWETNYISCDSLQMNCAVGERWALKQMQEMDSQLSKQGIEICRKIEELTAVPTYYYLFNYKKTKAKELTKPCPGCNSKWGLQSPIHGLYDFKCDRCRIVSTLSLKS